MKIQKIFKKAVTVVTTAGMIAGLFSVPILADEGSEDTPETRGIKWPWTEVEPQNAYDPMLDMLYGGKKDDPFYAPKNGKYPATSKPSSYTGLGYFLDTKYGLTPQYISNDGMMALAGLKANIIKRNGKSYLHLEGYYEIDMYVWNLAHIAGRVPISNVKIGDNLPGGETKSTISPAKSYDEAVASVNKYYDQTHADNKPFDAWKKILESYPGQPKYNEYQKVDYTSTYTAPTGYAGPSTTIPIDFHVNGSSQKDLLYKSDSDKYGDNHNELSVKTPDNITASYERYYGEFSQDYEIGSGSQEYGGDVQYVCISKIMDVPVTMFAFEDEEDFTTDLIGAMGIVDKVTSGNTATYTIRMNTQHPKGMGNGMRVIFEYTSGGKNVQITKQIDFINGEQDVTVTIPSDATNLHVAGIRDASYYIDHGDKTEKTYGLNYRDNKHRPIADWRFDIKMNNMGSEPMDEGIRLRGNIKYDVRVPGTYTLNFKCNYFAGVYVRTRQESVKINIDKSGTGWLYYGQSKYYDVEDVIKDLVFKGKKVDENGDLVPIQFSSIVLSSVKNPDGYIKSVNDTIYVNWDAMVEAPEEFSASVKVNRIQSYPSAGNMIRIHTAVDYASPKKGSAKLILEYEQNGEIKTTTRYSVPCKVGYDQYCFGDGSKDSTQAFEFYNVKYVKLVRIHDPLYDDHYYNQFLYCAHEYDSCGQYCNICGEARSELRSADITHEYDNDCDPDCNNCGDVRQVEHQYSNACDTTCNVCGAVRTVKGHVYDDCADTTCNICGERRTAPGHTYENRCDTTCNVCGAVRTVKGHRYDNDCDATCNYCGEVRQVEHQYSNACDTTCNVCGAVRTVKGHVYDDCADTTCNICGATRKADGHVYDGCTDTTCNICGATRKAGDHVYDGCTDTTCNNCGATRKAGDHVYDDCADTTCNVCGAVRQAPGHTYDNPCHDVDCNVCGYVRGTSEFTSSCVFSSPCDPTCDVCGSVWKRPTEHTYDDCEDTTCNVCGFVREAPGHQFPYRDPRERYGPRTCEVCGYLDTGGVYIDPYKSGTR